KPLHDLDQIAIGIIHKKPIATGNRCRLSRWHAEIRKMLPRGRGIFDLQREMARTKRVGRLARNQMNMLRTEVVPDDNEIERGWTWNLGQDEHVRVKASRQFEVGHDD